MSQVRGKIRCPRCAGNYRDNHGDNLIEYMDGGAHCFSCGYHRGSIVTAARMRERIENYRAATYKTIDAPDHWEYDLPPEPLAWLRKYGLTDDEIRRNGIAWDPEKYYLVFPIYDGDVLKSWQGRYFGPNSDHPKYKTEGAKDFFKIHSAPYGTPVVLVEDAVSAIKVARQFPSVPLLGAVVPLRLILSLLPLGAAVRIWLDKDKARASYKFTEMASQYMPDCATIISDEDPKQYNDAEIRAFIENTSQ